MVNILIPVHNNKEFTRNCLLSLKNQTYKDFRIVVIDDGSTDGTEEMLRGEFPNVHIITGDGNLWWTGAINRGLEFVIKSSKNGDYVLTLNNDLIVMESYLEELIRYSIKNPSSLIGSICVDKKDMITIVDGGVLINWVTAKYKIVYYKKKVAEINSSASMLRVDLLSGRGTLIPIDVFEIVGKFNENKLPHYGADYEFSFRAKKKNRELLVCLTAPVFSHTDNTGINNKNSKISWKLLVKSFFSIKSPYNFKYRWNFALLTTPKYYLLFFYILDMTRVIFGVLKNQLAIEKK